MQLSFPSSKSVEMSFKLGIAGTATAPTNVAVVLERDGKSLSYEAKQNGDSWFATIEKPGITFGDGDVKVSVNVLINNRLFTPMKSAGTIVGETSAEPAPSADVAAHDAVPEVLPSAIAAPEAGAADVPEQVVPEPVTQIVKPVESEEGKRKKAKDLLQRAQAAIDKKKTEVIKPIRMGLLKVVEPAQPKVAEQVEAPTAPTQPKRLFSIKKTKVIYQ